MNILVTGGAGFIGSNIVKELLDNRDVNFVRVLDNLSTGFIKNILPFKGNPKFEFVEGDIRDYQTCLKACEGINRITHHAALGSVPRSINNPLLTNEVNINGTLNIFFAAIHSNIDRIIYAASSSTYGDNVSLPKVEHKIGKPISPYAVTKLVNEIYADVFNRVYKIDLIGLRYFNIFGPNQSPAGEYAAVIPIFFQKAINNQVPIINGSGTYSRDFTFVSNAVQANIKSLFIKDSKALNQVYNIAVGENTTLNNLWKYIKEITNTTINCEYGKERIGDVPHSLADISKAKKLLGYSPEVKIKEGLKISFDWYKKNPN